MALDLTMGGMDTPRYTVNHCPVELYIQRIVEYMMVRMEPTDRALRDAGDIYPAHGQPGRRHEDAACGYLPADDPRVAENGCSCGVAHSVPGHGSRTP
jgi:hypothetical protein